MLEVLIRVSSTARNSLGKFIDIGIALSAQRDMDTLLDTIVIELMEMTHCDAGTLYLVEDGRLKCRIMHNNTMATYVGRRGETIGLPLVEIKEGNAAAYAAIHGRIENIPDVYSSEKFDFSGPKEYDKLTGYRTKSMLVIPLENNKGDVVGVLQLINAMDSTGEVCAFDTKQEDIFRSVASQAAIAVTNMRYMKENKEMFLSIVQVLSATIDERSPYNANHTKNVTQIISGFLAYLSTCEVSVEEHWAELENFKWYGSSLLDEETERQLIIAAWLHDIGKIITPLEIMDKATRLGNMEKLVMARFSTIYAAERVTALEKGLSVEQWEVLAKEIAQAKALVIKANTGTHTTEEECEAIHALSRRTSDLPDGGKISWLQIEEAERLALSHGTLTMSERAIMENHVTITQKLLNNIAFPKAYDMVTAFAAGHHEKLNGSGYPKHLTGKDIPLPTRILTIADIFEALTASDRPYKSGMSVLEALKVMEEMAQAGEIDRILLKYFKAWQLSMLQ